MSSRQIRKLMKQKELQELQAPAPREESSGSEDEAPAPKPKPNLFSGFAALGDADEQEDDEDDEDPEPAQEEVETVEIPKPASKKSKKKKKKAKKAVADASGKNGAPKGATTAQVDDADEIDRAIRELSLATKNARQGSAVGAETTTAARPYERICELLRVNSHHLKVINEMRSLFGREAIAAAEMEEQGDEQTRAGRRRQLQQNVDLETFLKGMPGRSLPEVTLRRNPFLPGKETWPRASTDGLTMKQIKDSAVARHGAMEFSFSHDENYNNLERQFFTLAQMYEPMSLVHFLHRHPYHVSSLIQVSKIAKQDQNSALSADLCERALFTFGRVSLSSFRQKLEEGKARLDFRRPENRQFWLAGYHYLKSLVMKGTYRTGLEWAKLFLSMDLTDPYGIIHFLHPLAIRAHESKWFIDFCDSEALDECDTAQDYIRQTLVLARLQQQDTTGAQALLVEGMERLPWLYSALFKALNLDVPRAIWGVEERNEHETLFTELYIHQTKSLWDNPQAIGLMKQAAALAQKVSPGELPLAPAVGRNAGRFVYLDNTPALMGLVPGGMLHGFPNWDFDPLPPPKEENVFSYESQQFQWSRDNPVSEGLRGPAQNGGGRRALERMLQQVMHEGAPDQVREALEEALGQAGEGADGEDEGGEAEAQQNEAGLFQAFMDMLWPVRVLDDNNDEDEDGYEDEDLALPGGWVSDSDDERPVVIYEPENYGQGGDAGPRADSDSDDNTARPNPPR